jgi:hypothetical protein
MQRAHDEHRPKVTIDGENWTATARCLGGSGHPQTRLVAVLYRLRVMHGVD